MIYLPELDISLHLRLPRVLTPEIEEALYRCSVNDEEGFDKALLAVLPADTVENRLRLAEAVLALRDNGHVPPAVAAVAVIDLNQTDSGLLLSSLAQSIAVRSGDERTPSGLLIRGHRSSEDDRPGGPPTMRLLARALSTPTTSALARSAGAVPRPTGLCLIPNPLAGGCTAPGFSSHRQQGVVYPAPVGGERLAALISGRRAVSVRGKTALRPGAPRDTQAGWVYGPLLTSQAS